MVRLGLMVRVGRRSGRLIDKNVIKVEEEDAAGLWKTVVTKWRQEVGVSATANLARFADPRLHVIILENDVKYNILVLPPQNYTGFTQSSNKKFQQ